MKSCLGSLLLLVALVALLATAGLIWYLSSSVKFSRKDASAPAAPVATEVTSPAAVPAPAAPPAHSK